MRNIPTISELKQARDLLRLRDLYALRNDKLRAAECKDSFYEFLLEFWDDVCPHKLINNFHIRAICDEMQRAGEWIIRGEVPEYDYLVVNIPPGMSKSTICSILFDCWLWVNKPSLWVITSSYSADAALPHSRTAKTFLKSDRFIRFFGDIFRVPRDMDAVGNFGTNKGGKRMTVSTGGSVTGKHADAIIIDDPHKPPDYDKGEAGDTGSVIEGQVNWHWATLDSRKTDEAKSIVFVIMQRLSDNDLTGSVLEKAKRGGLRLKHIKLPAEVTGDIQPPELAEQYVDGLLDPVRKGRKVLDDKKVKMGSVGYATQYLQDTSPAEGGIFKKQWWGFYDKSDLPEGHITDCTIDTAIGDKSKSGAQDTNDPYGFMPYTLHQGRYYVKWFGRPRLEFQSFIELMLHGFSDKLRREYSHHIADLTASMGEADRERIEGRDILAIFGGGSDSTILIENQTTGVPARQVLRSSLSQEFRYNVIGSNTGSASKVDRAKLQSPKVESGRVLLPRGNVRMELPVGKNQTIVEYVEPWVPAFIAEVTSFPNARHDEAVDCLEMALRRGHRV